MCRDIWSRSYWWRYLFMFIIYFGIVYLIGVGLGNLNLLIKKVEWLIRLVDVILFDCFVNFFIL